DARGGSARDARRGAAGGREVGHGLQAVPRKQRDGLKAVPYVPRSVSSGSTFVAARAGSQLAIIATATRMAAADANTNGSVELTSKSSDRRTLVAATAPTNPSTTPIAASRPPSRTISDRTAPAGAPSAMRMPISRLRRLTE